MVVRLRPHHLLCMLTFVGEGYDPAFVANYLSLARRLSAGEDIEVVEGPDDICRPLLHTNDAHCTAESVTGRDRIAREVIADILGRPILPGGLLTLDAEMLAKLRAAFADGAAARACAACQWSMLCTGVSKSGYPGVRLQVQAAGPERASRNVSRLPG